MSQNNSLKRSLLLSSLNNKNKKENKNLSTVKTKCIESKKYCCNKNAQISSLTFIKKVLDVFNVLKASKLFRKWKW